MVNSCGSPSSRSYRRKRAKSDEVGHEDVARKVAILEAGEIVLGLLKRAVQILAARFVFDKQNPLPEKVNKPATPVGFFDWLFEGSNAAAGNAKHSKKGIPESFAFCILRRFIRPFVGKF